MPDNDEMVCFCFGFTRTDILADVTQNGRSLIMERIIAEKTMGGCSCVEKNPAAR